MITGLSDVDLCLSAMVSADDERDFEVAHGAEDSAIIVFVRAVADGRAGRFEARCLKAWLSAYHQRHNFARWCA